jgi:hypothetical protein
MAKRPRHIIGAVESRDDGISVQLKRPETAALVAAVAETALAPSNSPRVWFQATLDCIDLAAGRRGLDEQRGAMRSAEDAN